jgi:hypothetical protein
MEDSEVDENNNSHEIELQLKLWHEWELDNRQARK